MIVETICEAGPVVKTIGYAITAIVIVAMLLVIIDGIDKLRRDRKKRNH